MDLQKMKKIKNNLQLINFIIIITTLILTGCSKAKNSPGIFEKEIKKVVSLSPAITSQMIDLEAEKYLVGVTAFHPPLNKKTTIVGTLVKPSLEKIVELKPDAVLYSEEDIGVQNSENFASLGIDCYMFKRNRDFESICDNYLTLSKILKIEKTARDKLTKYKNELLKYKNIIVKNNKDIEKRKMDFLVSVKPLITVSNISYIGQILIDAGIKNCYSEQQIPYPYVTIESLIVHNPDIIVSMIKNTKEGLLLRTKKLNILKCIKNNSIYNINPDMVGLYTPKNYINSLKKIIEYIEDHDIKVNKK